MKRLLCLVPLFVIAVVSAAAPTLAPTGPTAVSAFLKTAIDRGDVPGVAVAVVNKDGLLYHEAFGQASTIAHRAMAKDTIFNIASMTKAVTSAAIMSIS